MEKAPFNYGFIYSFAETLSILNKQGFCLFNIKLSYIWWFSLQNKI